MPPERLPGYINVDELLPRISLEQVASYYGAIIPEVHRVGEEMRMRCFLNCGRSGETGDRTLAMQADHPAKQWHCHQYGCGKGGNLVSLCDLLKPGKNAGGRPRGERFKEIAADLKAMVDGVMSSPAPVASVSRPREPEPLKSNTPLFRSDNERARGLVELDRKFVTDAGAMPPAASAYFRRRPFLTDEVCRKWRTGYLPRDTGEDKSGGTLRGSIVYPVRSESGDVLTWFGRDPQYEEKRRQWEAGGKAAREPEKFHFVKGYHRGLELFGQHADRLREPGYAERLRECGLIVVEGPNDVIALDTLGVPAVGLCSNRLTEEQAAKVVRFAKQVAGNRVVLLLDADPEGDSGAKDALATLATECDVRLGWSASMSGGRFRGRQPESLQGDEWAELEARLRRA